MIHRRCSTGLGKIICSALSGSFAMSAYRIKQRVIQSHTQTWIKRSMISAYTEEVKFLSNFSELINDVGKSVLFLSVVIFLVGTTVDISRFYHVD